jgi:hypothetical protein
VTRASHEGKAYLIRRASDSLGLVKTLAKATRVLANNGIPSLVVGGYAVQQRGYARYTVDLDIVVPDISQARECLTISGFEEKPGFTVVVTDPATKFEVHLLPGGGTIGPGPLPFPMPDIISQEPQIASLPVLIETKLSGYIGRPGIRMCDGADVVQLIMANKLPRDYLLAAPAREAYRTLWDSLQADGLPMRL